MSLLTKHHWVIALSILAVVVIVAAAVGVSDLGSVQASNRYNQERSKLLADLRAANSQGYTAEDLGPITSALKAVEGQKEPALLVTSPAFYNHRADQVAALDSRLKVLKREVLDQAQADATRQATAAKAGIEQDRSLGAVDGELTPLQQRLDQVARAQGAAHTPGEYRSAQKQAQALLTDVTALGTAQQAENQAVGQAGEQLKAQAGGNPDAIKKAGTDALAAGRNDASVAAYMSKPNQFKNLDAVNKLDSKLESYGQKIGSADPNQSAIGAAGAQLISGQIHNALVAGLPAKTIVISYSGQHLWAYEGGQLVQETPVTTGRPALPTDLGAMKVLRKDSPWKMHSPWPKGSPYYYPDTMVQMVVWFTNTGEGLHDASWQQCCWGPGSQYTDFASHGCIHLPNGAESFIYRWAQIGVPVVVYQGDGSPVTEQVSKISTDDQGNPLSGPKGA
jgi:lipoprotein-anchoring transpeptidase ErfK/SrfK